ncbi:hypothetical protein J1N35_027836 [Gossypium stocksii]|uniref:Uncharacterized protein n=1 Tax=Gossypium stocksii TaxID=47602 RepID=A0A9D3VD94_9ROSI|nr:hypothetical protein J1N35_027836 [Gossypium stocksii]
MASLLQTTTLLFIFSITLILIPNRHAIPFIVLHVSSQAVTPLLVLPNRPTVLHLTDSHRIVSLILQAAAPPPHQYYYDYDYGNLIFNCHWVSTSNTNTFVHAVLSLHNLSQGNLHTTGKGNTLNKGNNKKRQQVMRAMLMKLA